MDSNEIIDFWFNNEDFWFNSPDSDVIIKEKFQDYLNYYDPKTDESDPRNHLAKIILYDQFTRHFYRNDPSKYLCYLEDLCRMVHFGIKNHYDLSYTPSQRCFFLMPLRHSNQDDNVKIAYEKITEYINEKNSPKYKRFYYQTIKQYSKYNDIKSFVFNHNSLIPNFILYTTIIDRRNKTSSLNPFKNIYDFNKIELGSSAIYRSIRDFIKEQDLNKVTVSLSGGVDSMLVLSSMILLRERKEFSGKSFDLQSVHINYINSKWKSKLEREFVIRFCIYHKVPIVIRDITEITRTSEFREIYEDVTREIRFNMYRLMGGPIFLGHNLDDCHENMVTNIRKKQHFDNLYGMKEFSTISGVTICRPLLKISKEQIMETAGRINLFHTRNSTPTWSDRWNIRNVFLDFTEKNQPGFNSGLEHITSLLQDSYKIINFIVDNMMDKSIYDQESGTSVITIQNYKNNEVFSLEVWCSIFQKLAIKYNFTPISKRSIRHFVESNGERSEQRSERSEQRSERSEQRSEPMKFELSKQIKCQIGTLIEKKIIITIIGIK